MSFKRKMIRKNHPHTPYHCGRMMQRKDFESGEYTYICEICGKEKYRGKA